MKVLLFAAAIVVGAGAMSTGAQAQNYPWCAYYGSVMGGGGTNCGFSTYEQCMADVSGIGGFCNRNTQYVGPAGPHSGVRVRRHHRRYPQR
jgi:hypothetical protein